MKKITFFITFLAVLLYGAIQVPQPVQAQVCIFSTAADPCREGTVLATNESDCNGGNGCPGRSVCCVPEGNFCDSVNALVYPECTLRFIAQGVILLLGALLVVGGLWLIYVFFKSAFNYIIAGDSKDKTQQSRQAMLWSTLGLFGLASVYALFRIIVGIVPGLSNFIGFT